MPVNQSGSKIIVMTDYEMTLSFYFILNSYFINSILLDAKLVLFVQNHVVPMKDFIWLICLREKK